MQPAFTHVSQQLAALHAQDPRCKIFTGRSLPYEALYAQRMLHWTRTMQPEASEELLLAVDAQHLQRWLLPRESYAMDRKGYLLWREELKKIHAEKLADLMRTAGYPETSIQKASQLIRRKQMASDPDGQTLEDAACLTFLELDFADLLAKTKSTKMIEILQKTWKKMSAQGQALALQLPLGPAEQTLIKVALG